MYVIGTAGHVDHGKSALVQALTGIDPDRLQEEKDRGMTIDLGFAWLKLPSGGEVSIVDVPGHERFIKNMLAGAGGVDLALLVVAADEGVMPQTREHLAILDLLGIEHGVVALTKRDLVDEEWAGLVAADIEDVLKGTTLAGSLIVSCSAVTKEGLPELVAALATALESTPAKRDRGRPRLPVDRAFTVAGFGAVVTGTLIDGAFELGEEVEVTPAFTGGHLTALRTRVRGLQSHRHRVERALPGTRTAINLGGVAADELSRGQVVTRPGWLTPSIAIDVRLRALGSLARPLRHNLNVSLHSGSSETPAKLRLLDADEIAPGEEGWAQIRLARPAALVRGDRFVLRDANDTIGGGVIVETQARRHARKRPGVIAALERRAQGSPVEALMATLEARQPLEASALVAGSELGVEAARAALETALGEGRVVRLAAAEGGPEYLYTAEGLEALAARAGAQVGAFLALHPLRAGMPREELRSRLDVSQRLFPAVLRHLVASGVLEERPNAVATPSWRPRLTEQQRSAADRYLAALRAEPYSPAAEPPSDDLLAYLEDAGEVVNVGAGVVFDAAAYRRMVDAIVARLSEGGTLTLAQARDMFGTSRRYVQALLEHLDQERITERHGDERGLGRRAQARERPSSD